MAYTPVYPSGNAFTPNYETQNITDLTQGSQTSTNLEGLLKDVYLPGLNDAVFYDPSLYVLFEKSASPMQFQGQRIIKAFETQKGGGIGTITEGGAWVDSVPTRGQQGYEQIRFLNAFFEITNPAIKAATMGVGSYVEEATKSIENMMQNAKTDLDWQLGQPVDAMLGAFTSTGTTIATTGTQVTLTTSTATGSGGGGYFYGQHIRRGMKVDIYADSAPTVKINTTEIVVTDCDFHSASPKVTLSSVGSANTISNATNYRICPINQKSADGKRINSLYTLVDDSAAVWNLARATNPYLKSYVYDASSAELDEELLMNFITNMKYQYQSTPNALICSPRDFLTYFSNRTGERQFNTTYAMEWTGGVTGMGVHVGDTRLMLTTLSSIPQGDLFGIKTGDFRFATMTNGYEWVEGNGSILHQDQDKDTKYATAVNYVNFVCEDPGRQARIKNLAEDFPGT